jgi:hypothetical protein
MSADLGEAEDGLFVSGQFSFFSLVSVDWAWSFVRELAAPSFLERARVILGHKRVQGTPVRS